MVTTKLALGSQNQWVPIRLKETNSQCADLSSLLVYLARQAFCQCTPLATSASVRELRHSWSPTPEEMHLCSNWGPRCAGEEFQWGGDWAHSVSEQHMCCSPWSFYPSVSPSASTAACVTQQPITRANGFLVWTSQYPDTLCISAVVCFTLLYYSVRKMLCGLTAGNCIVYSTID